MENTWGRRVHTWNVEVFSLERSKAKKFWEEAEKDKQKVTEWAFERTREAFEKVAKNEAGRLSIVQTNLLRSTDNLRRIIAPVGGQGGVTMSYLCPHCKSFHLEDYIWWVSAGKKHSSLWCAVCI